MVSATGVIFHGPGRPLEVAEIELEEPRYGEVLVRIEAAGICRSDLHVIEGHFEAATPTVMGHEACGTIEAVGEGVDPARVGERVVLTFCPPCGRCRECLEGRPTLCGPSNEAAYAGGMWDGSTRIKHDGIDIHHQAFVSGWATHAVTVAEAAVPITSELDPALACIIGCAVPTGVMAVTRRAKVSPGESVAVFACGGVGLNVIQGARLVSAYPLVAIDPLPEKRQLARELGATHTVDPTSVDAAEAIQEIVPGGVDFAFEALGRADLVDAASRSIRPGGRVVLVGVSAAGERASFDHAGSVLSEHAILGTEYGSCVPPVDFPRLAELAVAGYLDLDRLVTHRFSLDDVDEAIATMDSGVAGRVVLIPDHDR